MAFVRNIGGMKMISVPVLVCLILASTFTGSVSGYPEKSYALYFQNKDVSSYVNIWGMPSLTAFTICFWMKTSDTSEESTVFSYSVPDQYNELLIENEGGLRISIDNKWSKVFVSAHDGNWHHICFTWIDIEGIVQFYKNGILDGQDSGVSKGHTTRKGGSVVLGQEQDSLGGGFKSQQAFQGHLENLNVWSYVLPATEILELSKSCVAGEGNVYKWNDFIYGVKGNVTVVMPSPCESQ